MVILLWVLAVYFACNLIIWFFWLRHRLPSSTTRISHSKNENDLVKGGRLFSVDSPYWVDQHLTANEDGNGAKVDVGDLVIEIIGREGRRAFMHLTGEAAPKAAAAVKPAWLGRQLVVGSLGEDLRICGENSAAIVRRMTEVCAQVDFLAIREWADTEEEAVTKYEVLSDCLNRTREQAQFLGDWKKLGDRSNLPPVLAEVVFTEEGHALSGCDPEALEGCMDMQTLILDLLLGAPPEKTENQP